MIAVGVEAVRELRFRFGCQLCVGVYGCRRAE